MSKSHSKKNNIKTENIKTEEIEDYKRNNSNNSSFFEDICPQCGYKMEITNILLDLKPEKITSIQFINAYLNKSKDFSRFIINFTKEVLLNTKQFKNQSENVQIEILHKYEEVDRNNKDSINRLKFICYSCKYSKNLKSPTILLSDNMSFINKTDEEQPTTSITNNIVINPQNKILDPTLPRTKDYVCKNKDCGSHKNDENKEAVFFRINNTYQLIYVCCVCKTYWLN